MKNKTFYIPSYCVLVYCHDYIPHNNITGTLTLGGLNKYYEEAATDVSRQVISKEDFLKLNPVELSEELLPTYEFMEKSEFGYKLKNFKLMWYLEEAMAMPSVKVYPKYEQPAESNTKKSGQGTLGF